MIEYSVTQCLPNDGQRCLAFGYKTFCCSEDKEDDSDWHDVTFEFVLSSYKLKKEIPKDLEESILEFCHYVENWHVNDDEEPSNHLIGVTKWKSIKAFDETI